MDGIFVGFKINLDPRSDLPNHMKYSLEAEEDVNDNLAERYRSEHKGGFGFHECANFRVYDAQAKYLLYLPPVAGHTPVLPDTDRICAFWFVFKADQPVIVGVHERVQPISRDGIPRPGLPRHGSPRYHYHASCRLDWGTLFVPFVDYSQDDGRYCQVQWGQGYRVLEPTHAKNILTDAQKLTIRFETTGDSILRLAAKRSIEVINRISSFYFEKHSPESRSSSQKLSDKREHHGFPGPDPELGEMGEKRVYQEECKIARRQKLPMPKWVSRVDEASPYDIGVVRRVGGTTTELFIEVKSTTWSSYDNVHVSEQQLSFARGHSANHRFRILNFDRNLKVSHDHEFTIEQLEFNYELVPRSYGLREKTKD